MVVVGVVVVVVVVPWCYQLATPAEIMHGNQLPVIVPDVPGLSLLSTPGQRTEVAGRAGRQAGNQLASQRGRQAAETNSDRQAAEANRETDR